MVSFSNNMQRWVFAALLLVCAVSAFTPDAAYKRSQVNLSFGNGEDRKNVFVYTQSTNDKRRRSAFVSMTDNLRKSVTGPPSFDDYMATRRRAMSEINVISGDDEAAPAPSQDDESDASKR